MTLTFIIVNYETKGKAKTIFVIFGQNLKNQKDNKKIKVLTKKFGILLNSKIEKKEVLVFRKKFKFSNCTVIRFLNVGFS